MRKFFGTLTLILALFSAAQAQQHVIKTNPIGLAIGNFNGTYERVLNDKSSVLVSANYLYRLFGIDVSSLGAGVGYRYYLTHGKKAVPTGFYLQPQIGFGAGAITATREDEEQRIRYYTFSLGAEIGYQWSWESGFTLDLGLGPNITTFRGDVMAEDFGRSSLTTPLPSMTVAVGYAF